MAQLKTKIVLRNDTAENWLVHADEILLKGEVALEYSDNGVVKMKVGDGKTAWAELGYLSDGEEEVTISGDGNSIIVDNGLVQIAGFADAAPGAHLVKAEDGTILWEVPTVTVDELSKQVTSLEAKITTAYKAKGSKENYADLPTEGNEIGDVWNIINADSENNIAAGDNVVWTESGWDKLSGISDLSIYATKDEVEEVKENYISKADLPKFVESKKYEISHTPEGTLVEINQDEIRVMCPENTVWVKQNVGETGNANMYYMGFKAYAPEGAVSFKEDDKDFIEDQTMHYFENNDFAGIDPYGRKYSITWLALAVYSESTGTWTYFGKNSTKEKYIGWYYSVEWYNENGVMIGSDCIRINLSNENCHNTATPYYMNAINVNSLTQTEGEYLILYGGSASDNIN